MLATTEEPKRGVDSSLFRAVNSELRIMPLGDSITSCTGVKPNFKFAYLSYRRHLWNNHILRWHPHASGSEGHGCTVTFVGSHKGCNAKVDALTPGGMSYPLMAEAVFGRTAAAALQKVQNFNLAKVLQPHHVLMHLGTNDVFAGTPPKTIISFLQQIVSAFPKSRFWIATLISFDDRKLFRKNPQAKEQILRIHQLNALIRNTAWPARAKVVDMALHFDPGSMLYDGLHPNDLGERYMAQVWWEALKADLSDHFLNCPMKSSNNTMIPTDGPSLPEIRHVSIPPSPSAVLSSPSSDLTMFLASTVTDTPNFERTIEHYTKMTQDIFLVFGFIGVCLVVAFFLRKKRRNLA